jgi:hypothetical protein
MDYAKIWNKLCAIAEEERKRAEETKKRDETS